MTMNHTPGPWLAHKLPMDRWLIYAKEDSGNGVNVAGTASSGFGPRDEAVEAANARLMAAAPDLLESLEPFAKAAQVYREAFEGFHVTGDTAADRRASEQERIATAEEAAFEYLANIGIDQFLAAETAIAKAKGESS